MDFFNCKVDHNVDRGKFKTAVKMWATGADGCNGNTGDLVELLQWPEELASVVPWSDVAAEFDAAIGARRHFDMESILNGDADELNALDNYADEVYGRVAAIYESKAASAMTRAPGGARPDTVFVIRYSERVDGNDEHGNFEWCYRSEDAAKAAMYADFEQKLDEFKKTYEGFELVTDRLDDYCSITVKCDELSPDTFEWWVDLVGIMD